MASLDWWFWIITHVMAAHHVHLHTITHHAHLNIKTHNAHLHITTHHAYTQMITHHAHMHIIMHHAYNTNHTDRILLYNYLGYAAVVSHVYFFQCSWRLSVPCSVTILRRPLTDKSGSIRCLRVVVRARWKNGIYNPCKILVALSQVVY